MPFRERSVSLPERGSRIGSDRAEGRGAGGGRTAKWRFAGAASGGARPPNFGLPEIAFAGRSNVGKSSLINALTRSRGLARTSGTPGRTQQINFFELPGKLVFADLPGYGFARVPERVRAAWKPLVEGYLRNRDTLRAVAVIVDVRRGVEPDDQKLIDFLAACGRVPVVVATKIDKLGRGERSRSLARLATLAPDVIEFSSVTGEGQRSLWQRLATLAGLR